VLRAGFAYSLAERQDIQERAERLLAQHQELSRSASAGMFKGGLGGSSAQEVAYHTVTHLLHQALRDVLGDHVRQRGSNITPDRVRFDFTHDARLSPEQTAQVEQIVNTKIEERLPTSFTILPLEQAQQSGAIGLFAEKYGETVKVYSIGPLPEGLSATAAATGEPELAGEVATMVPRSAVYSREFCGGPHVAHTGLIPGRFRIQKDERIGRDVVRIRAVLA
jgi:alanyl-tRNA synthetase